MLYGFNNTSSSFAGGPDGGMAAWSPGRHGHDGMRHFGFMMGGGLGGLFRPAKASTRLRPRTLGDDDHNDIATVVITQDGATKTCNVELPRGRLDCPSS